MTVVHVWYSDRKSYTCLQNQEGIVVLALILILLAIVLFGLGFALKLAWWVLVIALVLFVAGLISGAVHRRQL